MRILAAPFIFVFAFAIFQSGARAGDAVMWDPVAKRFVAEFSSTPIGGKDYLTSEQATESVAKTMRKQGAIDPMMVWKSDLTGYFAVCSALNAANDTVAAVGTGKTEADAKVNGLAELRKAGAEKVFFIAHRYQSYGRDSGLGMAPLIDLMTSPVENEQITSLSPDGRLALRTAHSRGWKLRRMDLVDLESFETVLELGLPTMLYGSITWTPDGQRFAFFGEEPSWGDTSVYFLQEGKYQLVALPQREKYPDPELELKPDEQVFKTINDAVRPKGWLKSGELELEHIVSVVVDRGGEKVGTVEAVTTITIHFDDAKTASIVGVAQATTRKAMELQAPPKASLTKPGL